jgi:hypothetical protein
LIAIPDRTLGEVKEGKVKSPREFLPFWQVAAPDAFVSVDIENRAGFVPVTWLEQPRRSFVFRGHNEDR